MEQNAFVGFVQILNVPSLNAIEINCQPFEINKMEKPVNGSELKDVLVSDKVLHYFLSRLCSEFLEKC